jgi:hypothetical protein
MAFADLHVRLGANGFCGEIRHGAKFGSLRTA